MLIFTVIQSSGLILLKVTDLTDGAFVMLRRLFHPDDKLVIESFDRVY